MILQKKLPNLWEQLLLAGISALCVFVFLPTLLPIYKVIFTICLLSILVSTIVFMKNEDYLKITRSAFLCLSIFLIGLCLIFYSTRFMVMMDANGIESVLGGNKLLAKLVFVLLCFLQPIILPLPEALTVPAGSAVFGSFTAAYLSFFGTISGIAVMFLLARLGGQKLALKFVKEKHLRSYQAYLGKNETAILFLLFIIPVLPDEIICMGAGLSGVAFRRFFMVASISKLLTASSLSYSLELAKALSLTGQDAVLVVSLGAGAVFILISGVKRILNNRKNK
ncbi:TVP38/TMEM64 family protein [Metabacillus idriensis]|uniref:TVP38/TMEM64 family protein n=1 Tax=Metabacillus idriensis TaxID=324768 RepID=UPI003D2D72FB